MNFKVIRTILTSYFCQSSYIKQLPFMVIFLLLPFQALAFYVGSIEVKVVDVNRNQLPSYEYQGDYYVMGRYNQRYMLQVKNHSNQRFEVVLTIDGRDVINGALGAYHHRGYVLDPFQSFAVEGFRRSDSEVAAFRFTSPGDSYAGRMGSRQNVGVIGVAIFAERKRVVRPYRKYRARSQDHSNLEAIPQSDEPSDLPKMRSSSRSGALGGSSSYHAHKKSRHRTSRHIKQPTSEIGTRYGESVYSATEETSFIRSSSRPRHQLILNYDSEAGLRRRGVIQDRPSYPTPFPNEPRYAPPPPTY